MAAPRIEAGEGGRHALTGDLVFETVPALLAAGDAAFAGRSRVELDLRGIGRIDSAGLALLLEWAIAARAEGRSLRYSGIPPLLSALAGIAEVESLLGPATAGDG